MVPSLTRLLRPGLVRESRPRPGQSSQELRHVRRDTLLQYGGLNVELLKLLVQLTQPHPEVDAVILGGRHADVPPWVEAPSLFLDLLERRDSTKARDIDVDAIGERRRGQLRRPFFGLNIFAAIQADNISQEFDLLRQPVPVRSVDLPE